MARRREPTLKHRNLLGNIIGRSNRRPANLEGGEADGHDREAEELQPAVADALGQAHPWGSVLIGACPVGEELQLNGSLLGPALHAGLESGRLGHFGLQVDDRATG
jgi:hypothetical protein